LVQIPHPRTLVLPTLLLLLVSLQPAGPLRAEEEAPDARAALRTETADRLRAHAAWCQKKKLYGKRDLVLERLLSFDSEDEEARRRLRYAKDESGAWVQDERYKPARNLTKAGLEEADTQLAEILDAYTAGLIALLGDAQTIPEMMAARRELDALQSQEPARRDIVPAQRALALRYYAAVSDRGIAKEVEDTAAWLRAHHGDDLAVRSALGLTLRADTLVLAETARTLDGGAGIDKALERAGAIEPTESPPTAAEAKIELPWQTAAQTEHLRVAGTADAAHLKTVAAACERAGVVFEQALGVPPRWREGLVFYLFKEKEERPLFLDAIPLVDNPTLALREKLDLVYADGQTLVVRGVLPAAQTDLAVNELLNQMLSDTFLKSDVPRAWHAEGISRYLAWKITGTRYAINVSGTYAGQSGDRAIPDTAAKWLAQARAQLDKGPAELQLLLGKGTDVFSARDALIAYAFAVYLLEGHPGLAGAFVRAHFQTKDVDRTCREILGLRLSLVEIRLRQWLDEILAQQSDNR
jgi:hypothetical protein